ncbi:MAG: L,D-transpeptidase [Gemmatimonadaceae bacterium]|nr:L,D-transpeptidase [Gemmatimonadaceae bacterium]
MSHVQHFLKHGGTPARVLVTLVALLLVGSAGLGAATVTARYKRDVARMVFNDNLEVLEDVKRKVGAVSDSLQTIVDAPVDTTQGRAYIVVSIADRRLWYRDGDSLLFTTRVATGSGKVLDKGGGNQWKFETPRGRLVVQSKESEPAWVPPDWHYVEVAHKKKLGLLALKRSDLIPLPNGDTLAVDGSNIVRRQPDGTVEVLEAGEGRDLIVNGQVVIPPFGTNQRRFPGVVGTHRLNLGDGYALHGTDVPSSIGSAASHGCVRLRNEDIETLFRIVPVGTPVYIY